VEPPDDDDGGNLPVPNPTTPPLPEPSLPPVDDVLTEADALEMCLADGVVDDPLTPVNELAQCVDKLLDS
jgi:hypothetical protein